MDLPADVEGKVSDEGERPNGSDHVEALSKSITNGDAESPRDEHQFQKAIAAWRSKQ